MIHNQLLALLLLIIYVLTNAQPIPSQQLVSLQITPLVHILGMMFCGMEYPFGQFV